MHTLNGKALTNEMCKRYVEGWCCDTLAGDTRLLEQLCHDLEVSIPRYSVIETLGRTSQRQPQKLNVLLPLLNEYLYGSLVASLSEKGFRGLRPSFSQVLGLIVLDQGRIQYIAAVTGVTKQAIATIANELARLGYITKDADPHDKRQIILRLSPLDDQIGRAHV